jgi:hypothetical protein
MDVIETRKSGDITASGPPQRGPLPRSRRRLGGEGFRGAHVMGWIALSSLVAAIFLSVTIAIAQGETTPLYITWVSALVMAAISGIIAAVLVLTGRARGARSFGTRAPDDIDT